jgi:signal transduction histidine kinase
VHKNLSIELEISPELPEWVVGDQQRLRQVLLHLLFHAVDDYLQPTSATHYYRLQVLLNLLFNAVKFTPQGSIVVTAAVQQEFANHLRINFSVEDTGIGIMQEG